MTIEIDRFRPKGNESLDKWLKRQGRLLDSAINRHHTWLCKAGLLADLPIVQKPGATYYDIHATRYPENGQEC